MQGSCVMKFTRKPIAKQYRARLKNRIANARKRLRQQLHLVPHLFTLGNAFFGFLSVIVASKGNAIAAAYFILLGAMLDGLDGRIARLIGNGSNFGIQLDSMADVVSFCFAPAFLMYVCNLYKIGPLGFLAAALFLLCGIIRLARFNIIHDQQTIYFLGMPTTIAGCFFASIVLNPYTFHLIIPIPLGVALLMILFALLMVSRVPFPTFKQINKRLYGISVIAIVGVSVIMGLVNVLLLLFLAYFLGALCFLMHSYSLKYFAKKKKKILPLANLHDL